jgi:hypothetical protein
MNWMVFFAAFGVFGVALVVHIAVQFLWRSLLGKANWRGGAIPVAAVMSLVLAAATVAALAADESGTPGLLKEAEWSTGERCSDEHPPLREPLRLRLLRAAGASTGAS